MADDSSTEFDGIGITQEFLEEALARKWGREVTKIAKFVVSKGSVVGDGYTTILLAVDIWLADAKKFSQLAPNVIRGVKDEADLSTIVKCFPENVARQEFLESFEIFVTEVGVYTTITPALLKFQEDLKIPKIVKPHFVPFVSAIGLTSMEMKKLKETRPLRPLDNYVMMLDIRKHGNFTLRDRYLGFDLDHHKLVIEAHAQLHAISWAYKYHTKNPHLRAVFPFLQKPPMMDSLKAMEAFLQSNVDVAKSIVNHNLNGDVKIVQGLDDLMPSGRIFHNYALYYEYDPEFDLDAKNKEETIAEQRANYAERLKKFTKDSILRTPGPVDPNEEPWNVLLHGDAWSNNMMFRYDEATGKPVEIILLDLQITREGDPMSDLTYALYTGTTRDYRTKHLSSMLHVYYDKFVEICNYLSTPLLPNFTYEELNRRFHRAKFYGFVVGLMLLPIILKNQDLLMDPEKMKIEGTKKEGEEKGESDKGKDGISSQAIEFEEKMKGFVDLFGKDLEYEKLNSGLKERMGGLLQDMSEQGVL